MKAKANSSTAMLFHMVFKQVFPVWERHEGDVPQVELERLDEKADFPRGLAAIAVKRLNRDEWLRRRCKRLFPSGL